jgi:hypothetical protein
MAIVIHIVFICLIKLSINSNNLLLLKYDICTSAGQPC